MRGREKDKVQGKGKEKGREGEKEDRVGKKSKKRRRNDLNQIPSFHGMCCYLLMWFEGPVLFDGRVTEVLHLPQHCCHESGPQLPCICAHPLPTVICDVLSYPHVIVKDRQVVKKSTATIHVPVQFIGF